MRNAKRYLDILTEIYYYNVLRVWWNEMASLPLDYEFHI
jgi:hypothetical protein